MRLSLLLLPILSVITIEATSIHYHKKRDTCSDPNLGHFITPETTTGDQAFGYCQSLGGKLADVANYNLSPLTAFINDCLGPNSRIRIQTWDTNTFGINTLAMFTGPMSGFGTVNIATNGEALYALCAMTHNNVINIDTPLTVNNAFLVEANRIQLPEEKEEDKENNQAQDYNIIQE